MRRFPYIQSSSPVDGTISFPISSNISFTVKTDLGASIDSLDVWVDNTQIVSNSTPIPFSGYSVVLTPGAQTILVDIDPDVNLSIKVFRISMTAEDDLSAIGSDTFQFSTDAFTHKFDFEIRPLELADDNIPDPYFTTVATATANSDIIVSNTINWSMLGINVGDRASLSGTNAGEYLIREIQGNQLKLWQYMKSSGSVTVSLYAHRKWADNNNVFIDDSKQFDYPLMKVWGDTQDRFFGGHPSDTNFPIGWREVPPSFELVNTNGGILDDQTEKRFDFALKVNPIPSGATYDRYSIELNTPIVGMDIGTRTIISFTMLSMCPYGDIWVGLIDDPSNNVTPGSEGNDRSGVLFKRIGNNVNWTVYHGGIISATETVSLYASFINKLWTLEMECTGSGSLSVSLYGEDNYVTPFAFQAVSGGINPDFDRWTITTFGDAAGTLNDETIGIVYYVDVEIPLSPGVFPPFTALVEGDAKLRQHRSKLPVALTETPDGIKTISTKLSLTGTSLTTEGTGRFILSLEDVFTIIDDLGVESPIIEDGLPKVSNQTDFDEISPEFRCNHNGWYEVLVDNNRVTYGEAPIKNSVITANFKTQDFSQLTDGSHSVRVVVHKRPVLNTGVRFVTNLTSIPLTPWVALYNGTNELTNLGYARQQVTLAPPMSGITTNYLDDVIFPVAPEDWGTVTHAALFTTATLGSQLAYAPIGHSYYINTGNVLCFPIYQLVVILSTFDEDDIVIDNLSGQVDGVATMFTTTFAYTSGMLEVMLDGVYQNHVVTGRVTEINNTLGTFSLSTAPRLGQRLVARYVQL